MFEYTKHFWDWADDNSDLVSPTVVATYFYLLKVANKLNWRPKFKITSTEVINGIGIKSYKTYKQAFDILVQSGLIELVTKSKNQYQCNEVALVSASVSASVKFTKANPKQKTKQSQSISHIHKTNKTNKTDEDLQDIIINAIAPNSADPPNQLQSNLPVIPPENFFKTPDKSKLDTSRMIYTQNSWWTKVDKPLFVKAVQEFMQERKLNYPTQMLKDFCDFYLAPHQSATHAITLYDRFDLESKLRNWHERWLRTPAKAISTGVVHKVRKFPTQNQ